MKRTWLLFVTAVAWAQEPVRVAPLQFDAASVKAVQPQDLGPSRITADPGRLKAQSVSIGALIAYAYNVQPAQIVDLKSGLAEADPRGFTLRASDRGPGFVKAKASAMSLEWLADNLLGNLSKLVVDGTGLKGVYEFEVDFEFDRADAMDRSVPVREAGNHIREGLLSALGLKLQSDKKAQVEALVIDQVERPEAN